MAPRDKAKAAGVSTSSFFDLKAELAKKEEEFSKAKAAGKSTALVGGVKRPDKKPTVWARQNTGVKSRAVRDIELEAIDRPTLEAAQAKLQRKAEIYEKLRKGKSGGLSEKQYDTLLVDFDQKAADRYESDSDDVDESLTVPKPFENAQDDPVIEYEDEFGRVRTARKSEIPRHLLPGNERDEEDEDDFDPYVIHNPVNHFPTYEPSAERVAAIQEEFAEENNPLNIHYDAGREVRAKGAGFYQFSADEETRQRQMEELRRAREETEKTRQDVGAVDVRPGEMEGMRAPEDAAGIKRSRAMEKRKRELEERRKLLDAKRRKTGKGSEAPEDREPGPPPPPPEPPAQMEAAPASDPFAVLESQAAPARFKGKGKSREQYNAVPLDPADAFLAQLEQDVLKRAR